MVRPWAKGPVSRHVQRRCVVDVDRNAPISLHLVVELGRDGQHHADALQSTHGCEGAAAVDPGYLRPSQHYQTTFEEVVRLDLVDPA